MHGALNSYKCIRCLKKIKKTKSYGCALNCLRTSQDQLWEMHNGDQELFPDSVINNGTDAMTVYEAG